MPNFGGPKARRSHAKPRSNPWPAQKNWLSSPLNPQPHSSGWLAWQRLESLRSALCNPHHEEVRLLLQGNFPTFRQAGNLSHRPIQIEQRRRGKLQRRDPRTGMGGKTCTAPTSGSTGPTWAPFPSPDCTDAVRPLDFSGATLCIVSKQDT